MGRRRVAVVGEGVRVMGVAGGTAGAGEEERVLGPVEMSRGDSVDYLVKM